MPTGKSELGEGTSRGLQKPEPDGSERPFFVLLEADNLITHLTVESDLLLEPVSGVAAPGTAVRLVLGVTVRPYDVHLENLTFA
jgi:hypothetical protein